MKKLAVLFAASTLAVCVFSGCNDKKNEDKLIAQVGSAKIYASDIAFVQRDQPYRYGKPEQKKEALDYLIESRLVAQEANALVGTDSLLEKRLQNLDERLLAQAYDDYFIAQNLGFTDKKLQSFFNQNKKVLVADSCKALENCRNRIAKKLYLKEHAAEAEQFVNEQIAEENVWKANIMYVVTKDSVQAKKAEQDLRNRVALADIQGLEQEKFRADKREKITTDDVIYNLLFSKTDSLPIDEVRLVRSGDSYVALEVVLRRLPPEMDKSAHDSALKDDFISEFVAKMRDRGDSILGKVYGLRYEPIVNAEIQKYYDEHKSEFGDAPIDSVDRQIENTLFGRMDAALDSNYVLASINGNPLVLEKDVQNYRREIPPRFRDQYSRRRCRIMLANWKLKVKAARDQGFDQDELVAKLRESSRMAQYRKMFSSKLTREFAFFAPENAMRAAYDRYEAVLFGSAPYERVRSELGVFVQTPDNAFRYEYFRTNPDSKQTNLDSIKIAVYPVARKVFAEGWFERYRRDLLQKYPVVIVDDFYKPWPNLFDTNELIARADSLHEARDLEEARGLWIRILSLGAANDSLFARAAFEIASIDGEQEKYKESDTEYAAFLAVWPENENAEKALFSRGFQMHEYLKNDSLALPILQSFQQKYPKSEMIESVNWLVKDIQSDGKLGEELLQKISEQEE